MKIGVGLGSTCERLTRMYPDRHAYIAVTPTSKGKTIWREPVSDHDYKNVK
jgi:hypothetical protein